jgi:hypothetical protein
VDICSKNEVFKELRKKLDNEEIKNYYEEKDKDIKGWSNKQIDSSLRKRYKF